MKILYFSMFCLSTLVVQAIPITPATESLVTRDANAEPCGSEICFVEKRQGGSPPSKDWKRQGGSPPSKDWKRQGGSPPSKDWKRQGGSPPSKDWKRQGGSPPSKDWKREAEADAEADA